MTRLLTTTMSYQNYVVVTRGQSTNLHFTTTVSVKPTGINPEKGHVYWSIGVLYHTAYMKIHNTCMHYASDLM